jgi:putative transposase
MPSQTAQQTLITLILNWRGFFKAKEKWRENPFKFMGDRKPYPPCYQLKKIGQYTAMFTNQQCQIRDGFLYFPTIREKNPILTTLEEKIVWNKIQT